MTGKKNCGCGEGLCNLVGTPCECEFKGRLSFEEINKTYDGVNFNFSEWFGHSKGLALIVNKDDNYTCFTKEELENFISTLQELKRKIYEI